MSSTPYNKEKAYGLDYSHDDPEKNSEHPCPYPQEIPRRLIKLFSFHGDTVLDPFLGSGTTAFVAKTLGRNFIGFELNSSFVKMAKSALTQECLIG